MSPVFTILLPTYKRRYLQECINSVLAQGYPHWELVIVNDASPEDIEGVVGQYKDPRIRYYRNTHNFGAERLVEQWNYCLSLAKGDYVICMGDDDRLRPCCLETYAKLIERYPDVEILHGQTDIIDEAGKVSRHTTPRPEKESAMSLFYHRTTIYHHQFIGDFCYQRDALQARGGYYNVPYAWGSDDISALQAAVKNGIANTQEVVFEYRDNNGSITRHPHITGKIHAILLCARWQRDFLRTAHADETDEVYRKQLRRGLVKSTIKKIYYVLNNAVRKRS